ncbi:hypothetical protein ASD79_20015 [Caulobacter sp. Root655]|uniref:DUF4167 domain-containing protein n=1 Tax=Caulobacter sp. Root655 TaxID=1736578 RepID=UPI0006FAF603|nr:DUF4167 domain-containing protein [Caulobacter sp. Root655]KRA64731.1 hypothetical protein ASD79_20015 [Caulobacter sp. Root655]
MRDFKGMKRQRGRNNRGGTGSGGKPQQHNANRAFDSNGPDGVKVRGAAQGVYEKYQQLARDATSSGDRVLAENYLQHAEHYFRVLRAIQPNRPVSDIIGKDAYSAYEIDFEAEPEEQPEAPEVAQAETQGDGDNADGQNGEGRRDRFENRQRDDRPRDDNRPREDRQRDDRPRDNNQNRDRFEGQGQGGQGQQGQGQGQGRRDRWRDRDDRPRDDNRPRDDRPREDRPRDDRPRDDRPRDDRPRDDRPREDRFRDERPREDRVREDRPAVAAEAVESAPVGAAPAEAPRRERPRRERAPRDRDPLAVIEPQATPLTESAGQGSPLLRGQDGDVSHAPAFLGRKSPRAEAAPDTGPVSTSSVLAAEAEAAPAKPKRRRAPRSFEGNPAPESEEV